MNAGDAPLGGEIILYQGRDGAVRVEVLYESETFWLEQEKIAALFGVDLRTVSHHLTEIYRSGELTEAATLRKIWRARVEGAREVRREIDHGVSPRSRNMEAERRVEQLVGRTLVLELPERFENQRVEVIVLTVEGAAPPPSRRSPPSSLAGRMVIHGDIFESVPVDDFEILR